MAEKVIGLDVGTHAVRAVALTLGDRPRLDLIGQVALPPGAVHEGEVIDQGRVQLCCEDPLEGRWLRPPAGPGRHRLGPRDPARRRPARDVRGRHQVRPAAAAERLRPARTQRDRLRLPAPRPCAQWSRPRRTRPGPPGGRAARRGRAARGRGAPRRAEGRGRRRHPRRADAGARSVGPGRSGAGHRLTGRQHDRRGDRSGPRAPLRPYRHQRLRRSRHRAHHHCAGHTGRGRPPQVALAPTS